MYTGLCFGHHLQTVEARKKFLYENVSEFFLQYDTVKNYYEQGYKKATIVYQITSILI